MAVISSLEARKSPEREAVRWLLRLQGAPLSDVEAAAFREWQSCEHNAAALDKARRLWRAAGEVASNPEIAHIRDAIPAAPKSRRPLIAAAAAACLVLAVAAGVVLTAPDPAPSAIATTIGERATVTLDDGSVLMLDTGSTAEVAFNQRERRVVLTRGQALFEVAKDHRRPFIVYASGRRIVAVGTAFNVRLDKSALEVTMVEGRVAVERLGAQSKLVENRERTELTAGQRLVATSGAGGRLSVTTADIPFVTAWTTGKLVFLNTPLADAVAEVNRYTRTPVVVTDPSLVDLRVNGVFRTGQTGEFARALAQIYPVSIDYRQGGEIHIAARSN